MKIGREDFLDLLKRVTPAINGSSTLPILGCSLMKVEQGKLTLEATDMGIRSVAWMEIDCRDLWSAAIPATFLVKLLSLLEPGVMLDFSITDKTKILELKYGEKGRATFKAYAADMYPEQPNIEWKLFANMPGAWLQDLDANIGFAAEQDQHQLTPATERIHLSADASYAFDRTRMAYSSSAGLPALSLHVLAESLRRVARIMVSEENLRIEVDDEKQPRQVRLVGANGHVSLDTVDVKVPDLSPLLTLASQDGASLLFEREPLMRYIKMAAARIKKSDLTYICLDARVKDAPSALYLSGVGVDDGADPSYEGPVSPGSFFVAVPLLQLRGSVLAITEPFVNVSFYEAKKPVRISGAEDKGRFHLITTVPAVKPRAESHVRRAVPA